MTQVGFVVTIPLFELLKVVHPLDPAATATGSYKHTNDNRFWIGWLDLLTLLSQLKLIITDPN
jgi:hypothetical protein